MRRAHARQHDENSQACSAGRMDPWAACRVGEGLKRLDSRAGDGRPRRGRPAFGARARGDFFMGRPESSSVSCSGASACCAMISLLALAYAPPQQSRPAVRAPGARSGAPVLIAPDLAARQRGRPGLSLPPTPRPRRAKPRRTSSCSTSRRGTRGCATLSLSIRVRRTLEEAELALQLEGEFNSDPSILNDIDFGSLQRRVERDMSSGTIGCCARGCSRRRRPTTCARARSARRRGCGCSCRSTPSPSSSRARAPSPRRCRSCAG